MQFLWSSCGVSAVQTKPFFIFKAYEMNFYPQVSYLLKRTRPNHSELCNSNVVKNLKLTYFTWNDHSQTHIQLLIGSA